jgi:MGT family glycosyltransferase
MARVLMVNFPYAGHTNPTLPLAEELVSRGHDVAYINAPEWRTRIEATGAAFVPYADYPAGLSAQEQKRRCFKAAYETAMQVGAQYDLLIYEMFFYLGKTLADRIGIPCVRLWSQPAWNRETVAYYRKISPLWSLSCRLIEAQVMSRQTAMELGVAGKRLVEAIVEDVPGLNIVFVPREFQPLGDTFDERYLFACPKIRPVAGAGQAIPYGEMKHPIVYISMGSLMSSRIFCKRCIRAFGGKDVSVILNTGRVPPESLGKLPPNIYAYSFVPQLEVLSRADLFITHGGMNSVTEAIYFGVPMLVMPVINDQPINAAQVERLGIGERTRAFPTTAGRVYRSARRVLDDDGIKARALALQQRIRAEMEADSVAERIEQYLSVTPPPPGASV